MQSKTTAMLTRELYELFDRDLGSLKNELEAFRDEQNIWTTHPGITNSPGHLCLHLCGNLRHYIGHILGGSDYIRKRDDEFNGEALSRNALLQLIEDTQKEIHQGLNITTEEQLDDPFPGAPFKDQVSIRKFLMHLLGHFEYHLGQINYYRRMME